MITKLKNEGGRNYALTILGMNFVVIISIMYLGIIAFGIWKGTMVLTAELATPITFAVMALIALGGGQIPVNIMERFTGNFSDHSKK